MAEKRARLVDFIQSREQLEIQYRDPKNLNARAAIYRFARPGGRAWPEWVFDHFDLHPDARVLEVGCGSGALWKANVPRVPGGWHVTLTDLMRGMVLASRGAVGGDDRFRFAQVDATELPFAAGTFDAVVANHMLYHVPDRPRAIAEIRRVLKPGGRLFATTNSRDHLRPIGELIFTFLAGDEGSPVADESELITFTLESGEAELRQAFRDVRIDRVSGELAIPDVQPVVDYLLSVEGAPEKLVGQKMVQLRQVIADLVRDGGGAFRVPTAAGMFIAVRN
jgi:ubiquinone/menaquinone biosynthesis C-methylase UbiE